MSQLLEEEKVLDMEKAEQFAGQFIADLSANYSGVMILLGFELGLYKAMHKQGPLSAKKLAEKTGTFERYIQEWLNNQAAGGYLDYHADDHMYELTDENALVLTQKDSPFLMSPAYFVVNSLWQDKEKLAQAFKTGKGIGWHEHHQNLFIGVESVYKAGYLANLNDVWIPSLPGMEEKLNSGGRVADVGCGHGASTILMAERFPHSEFFGFDYHKESIEVAQQRAAEKGLSNVFFQQANAEEYHQGNLDLICFFDCFHDFGNPLRAIEYARTKLAPQGSLMIVEPCASDQVADNFNPIGRMFYAASTALCVPHSHSENGDYCLGAQAGPAKVEEITKKAGYNSFKLADQNPFNNIYEVKVA